MNENLRLFINLLLLISNLTPSHSSITALPLPLTTHTFPVFMTAEVLGMYVDLTVEDIEFYRQNQLNLFSLLLFLLIMVLKSKVYNLRINHIA